MRKSLPLLVLLGCTIGFVLGLGHLFRVRFDVGDVYPEYSSLRADPLGTMALCESLERMPGITVRRDYSGSDQLPRGKDITYLQGGVKDMLDQLAWWTKALKVAREQEAMAAAA